MENILASWAMNPLTTGYLNVVPNFREIRLSQRWAQTRPMQLRAAKNHLMAESYYNEQDLKKFPKIAEFGGDLAKKFFDYYGSVFKAGALSEREKSLIALAVSHTVQCPYCIDAFTSDALQKGSNEAQMMEAVHVAAAIRGCATLVHSVQMMNKAKKLSM